MNVACGACPAKYVIPDEKVRGRKVRIPCKRCGAAIIVDGTAALSDTAGTLSDEHVSSDASAKSSQTAEKSVPLATTSPSVPLVAPPAASAPPAAPKQAVRPQRAIRQTIIGVAAPANAPPESAPTRQAPIRRPTPIYVRSPNVTAQNGRLQPEQQPIAAPGKMRSLRRTMVGGLDTEEPAADGSTTDPTGSKSGAPPVTRPIAKPRSRDIKHTIIGGLEAAVGSAPGADEPRKRSIPRQDTPPETWMAILPDGKTLRITESELSRAMSKAYVTGETPFWRTGMTDWVPLSQIPELCQLLNQISAKPQPKARTVPNLTKSVSRAPSPVVPKTQPSQPAPVPSFSRPPTAARLPVPGASTPKRSDNIGRGATSSTPAQLQTSPFTTSTAKVSRGPASVSARSSSPTLELVELDSDDNMEGISAQAGSNSNGILELQRLAASSNFPSQKTSTNAVSQSSVSSTTARSGYSSGTSATSDVTGDIARSDSRQVTQSQINQSSLEVPQIDAAPPIARRKPPKALTIAIVLILLLTCTVTSLVTRQPRSLYNFLHARRWDQKLDMISKKTIDPALSQMRRLLSR